jgi:hypothetical protein
MAVTCRALNLRNRGIHPAEDRNHRQRNKAITGFVPFRHRIIVSQHALTPESGVAILMERAGIIGEENLGVYTVGVESFKGLTRHIGFPRNIFPSLRIGIAQGIAHDRRAIAQPRPPKAFPFTAQR